MSYKEYFLKNKSKVIRNCIFISVLIVISLAGYFTAQLETGTVAEEDVSEPVPVAAEEQRTNSDCRIYWEFKYETCGHTVKAQSKIPADMAGLTLKEIEKKFKNLKVLDFSPQDITLQKKIKQYCPDHFILKAYDGVLGVFKNKLGTEDTELTMRLAIQYESVPASIKKGLNYGAVFNSIEAVQQYISEKINSAGIEN